MSSLDRSVASQSISYKSIKLLFNQSITLTHRTTRNFPILLNGPRVLASVVKTFLSPKSGSASRGHVTSPVGTWIIVTRACLVTWCYRQKSGSVATQDTIGLFQKDASSAAGRHAVMTTNDSVFLYFMHECYSAR